MEETLTTSLIYTNRILKKEFINKENAINNLSIILKDITSASDTRKVSSSNEPILENNTNHTDSEKKIVHELLDVKFEH